MTDEGTVITLPAPSSMKPGNIPTSRVGPILDRLIKKRWPYSEGDIESSQGELAGGYAILAEKVGCDPTAVANVVGQKHEGVDFDLADRLFCALGRSDIWRGELLDLYEGMRLLERCAHPNCSAQFPPSRHGGRRKRYCTSACANSARRGNRRIKHFKGRAQKTHSPKCRNGHPRTPENTINLKSGRIRCRICNNLTSNRGYHAKKAALAVAA